jgi:MFS family permease
MLALGLNDSQIGFIATIFMLSQVVFAFLSGPIVDKLGRRKATGIFDFIAWCIPCLIWWRAENFWYFLVAALISGIMMIPNNGWDCLLIEDAEKSQIPKINSLVIVCGQLSVLFAPIAAILFSRYTLVPAIRILYLNAFIVMTLKVVLVYALSRETEMGVIRMEESRGKSLFSLTVGYGKVLKIIGKSRGTLFALIITALVGIVGMINTTFWQVIVSQKLLVPDYLLPMFPVFRSIIAISFLFLVAPYLTAGALKLPLLAGFLCYFIGQAILILTPVEGSIKYIMLCLSLLFDGLGLGSLMMLARSLVGLNVNPEERARVQAILHMVVMAITSPFGWIAGILSGISRNLPFILTLCLLALGFLITLFYYLPVSKKRLLT